MAQIEDAFKIFDSDGDGKLSPLEMHQTLGACGVVISVEAVQLAVKDKGVGDLALLKQLVSENKANKITVEGLKPLFKVIDPANSGSIELSSLNYLLTNFNEKLSESEAQEFFSILKLPSTGKIPVADVAGKLAALVN